MTFEYNQIRNKYDIYNVKSTLDEFMKYQITTKYKLKEKTIYEYGQILLGILASICILKSYFHKTPFPDDKLIIILCTIGYVVISYFMEFFNAYFFGEAHAIFDIEEKQVDIVIRNTQDSKDNKKSKKKKGRNNTIFSNQRQF